MMNRFQSYHPLVHFAFFAAVVICTLLLMHPVFLGVSFAAAMLYAVLLGRARALRFSLLFTLPMLAAVAVLNPLFVHQGMTMLFYIHDNPVTLEAVLFGAAASVMLAAMLLWFFCCNEVFTSDEFLYLFGRAVPSLALLLSMTLRLIPRFKTQIGRISRAQAAIGMGTGAGNLWKRARNGMRILSILITWALENAVETADSMKARGYGLPGRTAFSIFRFCGRDAICLAVIAAAVAACVLGQLTGTVYVQYYPYVKWTSGPATAAVAAAYGVLCFLPAGLEGWGEWKWRSLQSTI
ncbi:energy-coupling factor transporter transmembrane protein EcfT [Ethanoligenens harbinense]|nr:energy-coupling factor transporter transmembrane protein EcfT [Ethanoligenens harbinense YUAN-3]AYF39760.1 energy-coupling factor transporter transmembrane protein EcfT [Ethanoligenens harbinense]AYF42593.1 energy-coupling factor transporter transmembrane protein EcfT [Ethanoligenens harbinense]QCN93341.1 energy-coupling factor transporter transmembrane protein EcfT [Ethanoligenens harbinense]